MSDLEKAAQCALSVLLELDESEMARLRGKADIAIADLRKALGHEFEVRLPIENQVTLLNDRLSRPQGCLK
jgi:ligand-binding sensor domain-containing protein